MRFPSAFLACLFMPFAAGPAAIALEVGQTTLRLHDSKRDRPIVVELWYPTNDAPTPADKAVNPPVVRATTVREGGVAPGAHPLVLLSHGTGGHRQTLEWLGAGLARHGFVAASIDHWGNTADNAQPEYFLRSWERPQDLSFVLTHLLQDPTWKSAIAPEQVVAAGFSLGGYTVLALAGAKIDLDALHAFSQTPSGMAESRIPEFPELPEYMNQADVMARLRAARDAAPPLKDPRIKGVLALAPALGAGFTRAEQLADISVPVYVIAPAGDRIAPVATNAERYKQLYPSLRYEVVPDPAGHFIFLNVGRPPLTENLPALFVDAPGVERGQIHADVIQKAVAFFLECLPERQSPPAPSVPDSPSAR